MRQRPRISDNAGTLGEATILNGTADSDGAEWTEDTNGSDIDNEYLYTGRRLDPETGLQLNRHRFYTSHLGRWVNRDPIGYRGGRNLYGYVSSRPIYYRDPSGLMPWSPIGPGGGVYHDLPPHETDSLCYFWDYLCGDEEDHDLGEDGLLDDYRNDDDVQNITNNNSNPGSSGGLSCDGPTSKTYPVESKDGGEPVYIETPFMMGGGKLQFKGSCTESLSCEPCCGGDDVPSKTTITCTITYWFRDPFEYPFVTKGWGIPWNPQPGFDVIGEWTETTTQEIDHGGCDF